MGKRISFDEYDAAHLYELALEHFCVNVNSTETNEAECYTCDKIKSRLEKFIGKEQVKDITRTIKRNGYCNKLQKSPLDE